jgi:hypothetical protein
MTGKGVIGMKEKMKEKRGTQTSSADIKKPRAELA